MSYLTLPKRVFNSPLVRFANFKDGSHVNLICLSKPYADGTAWAVHETTTSLFCSDGLFKTYEKAKEKFDRMVKAASLVSPLINEGLTSNSYLIPTKDKNQSLPLTAEQQYPEYEKEAEGIVMDTLKAINNASIELCREKGIKCPYPAQCLLEMVVKKLESRI